MRISDWSSDVCSSDLSPVTLLLLACGLLAVAMPGIRPKPMLVAAPRWFVRLAVASVGLGMFAIVAALLLSTSVGALHLMVGGAVTPVDHLAPEGVFGSAAAAAAVVWIRSEERHVGKEG